MLQRLKNKYKNLSLARKIFLPSILVIVFVMISFTVIVRIFYARSVVEIAADGYSQKFKAVSENCMELFLGAEQLSKVLCTDEDIQNWFDYDKKDGMAGYVRRVMKAESQLDYVDALYPNDRFSSISIYTRDGDMLNTNNIRSKKEIYKTFFQEIEGQTKATKWIDLYELQIEGYNGGGIAYVRPYRNYTTGEVRGYIMVEYNSDILINNFSGLRYGQQGQYVIADMDGNVKIYSDQNANINIGGEDFFKYAAGIKKDTNIYEYKVEKNALSFSEPESSETDKGYSNEKYLVTVAPISTLGWVMIGLTPLRILTERGDIIIRFVYLIGFIALLCSGFLNFYIAHSVTKPLSRLTGTMERFGRGELTVNVPVEAEDEIGRLSKNFNKMTEEITRLIDQVYEEQRLKRKYEISVLQAQINPHFLYNTLNSVCSLVKVNKPEEAYAMVYAIGQFYRTALSDGHILVPISEEIANIENYIRIQSIRYGDMIRYDIQVEDSIKKLYTVKLTLQPLIENAIYHGVKQLEGTERTGEIQIKGWREEDKVYFSVKDNGVGMEQERASGLLERNGEHNQTSFGLYSIHERIQLYFGKDYGLHLTGSPGKGVTAIVKIPCKREREDL